MSLTVVVHCPRCQGEHLLVPGHGEIVAVYCLCRKADTTGAPIPTRMDVLRIVEPAVEREPVAV
jgi:hypothetical protein